MKQRISAIAQLLAALLAASLVGVLAKLALREVSPFTFVWLQIAIGGSVLSAYTFVLRGERIPKALGPRVWACIVGIALCNFTIARAMHLFSLERLPAVTHTYLISFTGIVTMAMSAVFLKERPSLLSLIGALLALLGLRVFFDEIPTPEEGIGIVYAAIVVVALSAYNTLARELWRIAASELSNNVLSTVALLIGGAPLVAAGLLFDWPPRVVDATHWSIIALSGVVGIAIVLTLFNHVLRTLRSYEASILASGGVVYTALFAYPILEESLDSRQILGVAMMLVGLCIVQVRGAAGR